MEDQQNNEQVMDSPLPEAAPPLAEAAVGDGIGALPSADGLVRHDACADADRPGDNEASDAVRLREKQRQRIVEYLKESLARIDPAEANLGAVIANLQTLQLDLYRMLTEEMPSAVADSDEWSELLRSVFEPYLRITKQLERFMAVEMKLRHQRHAQAIRVNSPEMAGVL